MRYVAEDPTVLVGGVGLAVLVLLAALRVTQQGKYLIGAVVTAVLALVLLGIEHFWVTDCERIEQVVEEIRAAVAASDADGVIEHLTPDVQYTEGGTVYSGPIARAYIHAALSTTEFDVVRVSRLRTHVGRQARRGTADFRVFARGVHHRRFGPLPFSSSDLNWSLGFVETAPHVWSVNRLTPTRLPRAVPSPAYVGEDGRFLPPKRFNPRGP